MAQDASDLHEPVTATWQVSRFHEDLAGNLTGRRDIDIVDLSIEVNGKFLLAGVNLKLQPGRRYGLIGRNGCGKSTLMNQLAYGALRPVHLKALHVLQEDVGSSKDAISCVLASGPDVPTLAHERDLLHSALASGEHVSITLAVMLVLERKLEAELTDADTEAQRISGQRGQQAKQIAVERGRQLDRHRAALRALERGDVEPAREIVPDPDTVAAELIAEREAEIAAVGGEEEAKATARDILEGLGLPKELTTVPTSRLSGGQRMRIALARALYALPDILLLDEPTNHLDLRAVKWLENWLLENVPTSILVVVSHDREFLDAICTDIIQITAGTLKYHAGDYSSFASATRDDKVMTEKKVSALSKKQTKIEESIRHMEKKAKESGDDKRLKQVKSRRRKLEERFGDETNASGHRFKLNRDLIGYHHSRRAEVQLIPEEKPVTMKIPCAAPLGYKGPILAMDEVSVGYSRDKPILTGVTLPIEMTSRIAVLGDNGVGKSTMMKTLAGVLKPLAGEVHRHPNLRVAYFSQDTTESLSQAAGENPLETLRQLFPEAREADLRRHLGNFGLGGALAMTEFPVLSGGQKVRAVLALLLWEHPHILLLDEPTNHLDLDTAVALAAALESFEGGVVLASHDRALMRRVAEQFLVVKDGKLKKQRHGLGGYLEALEEAYFS